MSGARGPVVIGLAGGIGSGKSTVARSWEGRGCRIVDADDLSRRALGLAPVHAALRARWGDRVFTGSGAVDRRKIASIVFADAGERRWLEALIHPLVIERIRAVVDESRGEPAGAMPPAVVIDAPLLFEAGLDALCDLVVFVDSPSAERLQRVQTRRSWTRTEFDQRENAQLPLDVKRDRADYVLSNRGDLADLDTRSARLLESILNAGPTSLNP